MTGPLRSDGRGVSEVLGYIFIFSLVITAVALVYTSGLGALTEIRDAEQLNSAERAMEGSAASLENLQRGDPSRASELRLSGGTVSVLNDTTTTVTVNISGGGNLTSTYAPGSLRYAYAGSHISYQVGAVLRSDGTSGFVERRPSFACSDERAMISMVTLRSNQSGVGGESSVVIVGRLQSNRLVFPPNASVSSSNASSVTVAVSGPDASAWTRYFDRHPHWTAAPAGPGYTCEADRVFVRHTVIQVRFVK